MRAPPSTSSWRGRHAVCDSDAVSIDGSRITLSDEGTYLVCGALTDGQIVVDAGDTDKVQIVLASASLTCADSAAIYSKSADKVFLTLAEGTENTLTNGGSYTRHRQEQHRFRGVLQDRPDPQRFRQSDH